MAISYVVDGCLGLIAETWSGEIFASDLTEYWIASLGNERHLSIRRTLADVRNASLNFTQQELLVAIQTVILPRLRGRGWVAAIVVGDVPQFKMSRHYQIHASGCCYDGIFSSPEEARAWLLRQEPRN